MRLGASRVNTHLPALLRAAASSAAAVTTASGKPARSVSLSMTSSKAFDSAKALSPYCMESIANSLLISRSVALSSSERRAPARTKSL